LKVTYTEEALADIVEAITYLNERNSTAAATLTLTSRSASNAWQIGSLRGQSRDFARVLSCGVGASRRSESTTSGIPTNS
jgi:hypothetical protein